MVGWGTRRQSAQRPNHICRSVLGCTRKPQRRRSILFPVVWYRGTRPTPSIFACAAADDHAFPSTTVAEQRQLESHPGRVTLVMGGVCAHDCGFNGVQRSHCCLQPVNPWVGSEWQIYNGECVNLCFTLSAVCWGRRVHTLVAEYFQWQPTHNENSKAHTVKVGGGGGGGGGGEGGSV